MLYSGVPEQFLPAVQYIFINNYELYLIGIGYTLLISILGTFLGLILSLLLTILRLQENENDGVITRIVKKIGEAIGNSYVQIFRGTPMMVQAVVFYYGLASIGIHLNLLFAGILIVTLNTAAYLAEIIRSGINAVDKGQFEGAKAVGLTRGQTYRYIIFPQVLREMLPSLANELVVNIKDTAVLSVIGISEFYYMGKSIAGTYYRHFEAYFIVAIIYLIVVLITTRILTFIVNRTSKDDISLPSSQTGVI